MPDRDVTTELLQVEGLTIRYHTSAEAVTAVSDASFTIANGEYFGLVGESGCGKSTVAKSLLGILDDNSEIAEGAIRYKGTDIQDRPQEYLNRNIRWKEISYIPQSAMNSLDPLTRISEQALDIADAHTDMSDSAARERFEEMFDIVGIQRSRIDDYPHEFSGGMQQRVIIALALFLEPSLIIADEPTTALDVIMQDQIFKYLDEIKETVDVSMLLITHDISVIFETCDRLAIMHSGQICELGSAIDLFDDPRHPYSILLQRAFPDVRNPDRDLETIDGYPPRPIGDVDYCTFVDRCPWAVDECAEAAPPMEPVSDDEREQAHFAACFRKEEVHRLYREEGIAGSGGNR